MKTSVTIILRSNKWTALIIQGSQRKTIALKGNANTSDERLVAQLPKRIQKQIEQELADLVFIY